METQTSTAPRVWIGCLSCYNNGKLVGDWVDVTKADTVTIDDLHGDTPHEGCEEMLCMDTDGLPANSGEITVAEAAAWGVLYEHVGIGAWDAFCAWIESGNYVKDADGLPSYSVFDDRYLGCWDSFSDFLADDLENLQADWPETAKRYFDFDAYERDAAYDYTQAPSHDGGVHIFTDW